MTAVLGLEGLKFGAETQLSADAPLLMLGVAGTPPAATTNDCADFNVMVPYAMTLTELRATVKTAPSATLTAQIRRSTDSGASFSNAFGTVSISSGAKVGTADPANLDIDAGDVLQISVTVGGGTGTNLAVMILAKRR